jgi:hypothetical protein
MVNNMSLLDYIVTKLKSGILTFINATINANRDYYMHDYKSYTAQYAPISYVVGTDNKKNSADQKKLFTSKSTLIYSNAACTIKFNNANNVTIDILANTWYEFYLNIHMVIILTIGADGTIYMYFEGTLPEECRLGA